MNFGLSFRLPSGLLLTSILFTHAAADVVVGNTQRFGVPMGWGGPHAAYMACQDAVGRGYLNPEGWHRMSILNVARMGKFSSDRAILEYCREIWGVEPQTIVMPAEST